MAVVKTPLSDNFFYDFFHTEKAAWLVLCVALSLTFYSWHIADSNVERRAIERFDFEVVNAVKLIQERISDYEQVLRGGVALFESFEGAVDRQVWKNYVDGLELQTYYPGIQGLGYAIVIKPEDLASHEAQIRAEGFKDYFVYPVGQREIYTSIIYLEPFDWRNQRAFGYDMYSESNRAKAMSRARDQGLPSVTNKITLVQETERDVQAGFLMYLPYYNQTMPIRTEAERRAALVGYVYSPFRMANLMYGILRTENPELDFAIYDHGIQTADTLLYSTTKNNAKRDSHESRFTSTNNIILSGNTWVTKFSSTDSLEGEIHNQLASLILLLGLIFSGLLFWILWSFASQRRRISKQVELITGDLRDQTKHLKIAQQTADLGVWEYDLQTGELNWDTRMYALYGITPGEGKLLYEVWQNSLHPEDQSQAIKALNDAISGSKDFDTSFRIVLPDKSSRFIKAHGTFIVDKAGSKVKMLGVNYDISDIKSTEQKLKLAASVYHNAQEAFVIANNKHKIIDANPEFSKITNFDLDDVKGASPWESFIEADGLDVEEIKHSLFDNGFWQGELKILKNKHDSFDAALNISCVKDNIGNLAHYVYSFKDISHIKKQQEELEHLAHYDSLTKLPNRILLNDRMEQAINNVKRNNNLLAVCFIDFDKFKNINDTYGHGIGDELLIKVADRIKSVLRGSDSAARLGGDEFLILLTNLDTLPDCENAIDRVQRILSMPYKMSTEDFFEMTFSIGISIYPSDNSDQHVLIRHADHAMYQAKQSGRNCYKFFDPAQDKFFQESNQLLLRAGAGLETNEFQLYYQPQVNMRTGEVVGVEALIRWQHPERGLLPPDEFLPVIERHELAMIMVNGSSIMR
jgi:diguanylate cyclase (GGDEF)-like protein/PAS domain S-box-containing protein